MRCKDIKKYFDANRKITVLHRKNSITSGFLLIFRFISVCLLLLMKKIGFIYFRLAKNCSIYNCFDAVAV